MESIAEPSTSGANKCPERSRDEISRGRRICQSKQPDSKLEMIEPSISDSTSLNDKIASSTKPASCCNAKHSNPNDNTDRGSSINDLQRQSDVAELDQMFHNQRRQVTSAMKAKLRRRPLARPLRSIDVVGQLNHPANRGLLLIMLALMTLLAFENNQADAVSWPFRAISGGGNTTGSAIQMAVGKRWPRNSGEHLRQKQPPVVGPVEPPVPAPISQQFHYFWNHDLIDPKLMGNEAQKILAEAQLQTDQLALSSIGQMQQRHSNISARMAPRDLINKQERQDTMLGSATSSSSTSVQASPGFGFERVGDDSLVGGGPAPVVLSPVVQQQLTNMVLQMQRQHQMSMMMQPRFDAQRRGFNLAQSSLTPPMNPLSRYWMSGSSHQPVIAAPPAPIQMPNPMNPFANVMAGSAPAGTMAGVPVYGPFMVAPTLSAEPTAPPFMGVPLTMPHQARQKPGSNGPSTNRFAGSLLSRRKHSWPLFHLASSLGNAERSSLRASGSQLRPVVVPAPVAGAQPSAAQQQLSLNLAPETAALIDIASSRLADAIASQMQSRAAQQRLAAVLARTSAIERPHLGSNDAMQSSGSMPLAVRHVGHPKLGSMSAMAHEHQRQHSGALQPPYNLVPSNGGFLVHGGLPLSDAQLALSLTADPLLTAYQNSVAELVLGSLMMNNGTSPPYGSRLKRRHLNASDKQSQTSDAKRRKRFPTPPYTVMEEHKGRPEVASSSTREFVEPTIEQYHSDRPSHNTDESFEELASVEVPVAMQSFAEAPGQMSVDPQSSKRIVKKDASSLVPGSPKNEGSKLDNKQQSAAKNDLRHLFLVVPPENSPSSELIDLDFATPDLLSVVKADALQEKQTQLRRLKRSSPFGEAKSNSYSSISSAWKSMDTEIVSPGARTIKDDEASPARVLPKPQISVMPTTTSWIPRSESRPEERLGSQSWSIADWPRGTTTSSSPGKFSVADASSNAALLRRQAELGSSGGGQQARVESDKRAGSTSSPKGAGDSIAATVTTESIAPPVALDGDEFHNQRQGKALKIKRITSSASVMHHPISKFIKDKTKSAFKRGIILVGSPVNLTSTSKPISVQAPKSQADFVHQDPMSASLSESTRVVNYFQNVDNEKPAVNQRVNQNADQRQQPVGQAPAGSQPAQINLAFSAPSVRALAQNETQQQQQQQQPMSAGLQELDMKRQQTQYQSGKLGSGQGFGNESPAGASNRQQPNRALQQPANQLRANAGSADISSAATGNLAYVNNMVAPGGSGGGGQAGLAGPGNQPARFAGGVSPANKPQDGLYALQGSLISSLLSMEAGSNQQRNGSPAKPMFGPVGQSNQLAASQSGKTVAEQSSLNGPQGAQVGNQDRSTMADQSNSYNTEYLPPPSLYGPSMSGTPSVTPEGMTSSQQPSDNGQSFRESLEPLLSEQQNLDSSSGGLGLMNGLSENQASGSYETNRNPDPDSEQFVQKQFNQQFSQNQGQLENSMQQQFQMPGQSNQSGDHQLGDLVSEPTPAYSPASAFGTGVRMSAADLQLNGLVQGGGGGQQVALPSQQHQQQLYSDQLIALGNAVSNYNRRRFNQQLHENAIRGPVFRTANGHPAQLMEMAMSGNYPALSGSGSSNQFSPVDEEAAAGTLAAAGISTYPLMSQIPSQGGQLADLSGLLMAGSEQARSEHGDDSGSTSKGANKKAKKKIVKQQVSHHYHFNSFGSPFEDTEGSLAPGNPLEFGAALESYGANQKQLARQRGKANKENQAPKNEQEKEEEEEREKPKKKGFLRRLSLRNLFKKLRRDKKKPIAEETEANGSGSGDKNNNEAADERQ